MTADREALGREIRRAWVEWAREQPNPKPSWLAPWEDLSEPDREADRRIGERLYSLGFCRISLLTSTPEPPDMATALRERARLMMERGDALFREADMGPTDRRNERLLLASELTLRAAQVYRASRGAK